MLLGTSWILIPPEAQKSHEKTWKIDIYFSAWRSAYGIRVPKFEEHLLYETRLALPKVPNLKYFQVHKCNYQQVALDLSFLYHIQNVYDRDVEFLIVGAT